MASLINYLKLRKKYKKLLEINENLTNKQIDLLLRNNKDTIIRAIPGSGKTTILILKIKQLLIEHPEIQKIQCISYTNVTVDAIRKKCIELLPIKLINKVEFSTFHSFCFNNILKPFNYLFYSKGMRIYNNIFNWEEHGENLIHYLNTINIIKRDSSFLSNLKINKRIDYNIYMQSDYKIDLKKMQTNGENPYICYYWKFLKLNYLIDFNLINYFSLRLIRENELIRTAINHSYDYIFIDEFQDVSEIQSKIIEEIVLNRKKYYVKWILIGDPNQSIYRFAGANIKSMFQINTFFQNQNKENCEIILSDSFRCSDKVFNFSRDVYNSNLKCYIGNINQTSQKELYSFLEYLFVDNQAKGHQNKSVIKEISKQINLNQGICFIGSDKYESLDTYKNYKENLIELFKDSQYINFENFLYNFKAKYGYRFIKLFTLYLIVKYDFYNNLHEYQRSLSNFIYHFEKIQKEEFSDKSSNLIDFSKILNLEAPLTDSTNIFDEFNYFHQNLCEMFFLPITELKSLEKFNTVVNFKDFIIFLKSQRVKSNFIEIKHLHAIKGLEYNEVVLKTDKIPYKSQCESVKLLLKNTTKNNITLQEDAVLSCVEELNKLYVMMTRSKSNLYIIDDKSIFIPQNLINKYN